VDEGLGLAQLSRFRDIPVGRFIYRQDSCEPGEDSIFIVLRGSVALQVRVRDAKEIETERLGPGELFGGLPLLADVTHTESAVAADDTRLIEIDREAFRYLRLAKPWLGYRLAQALLRITTSRLRALFARLQGEL
jgi:CRP-like cAMP-binding protein